MITETQLPPVCAGWLPQLWEYLDHELPEPVWEDMNRHVADCPRCGPIAAFERRLLDRIAAVRADASEVVVLRERLFASLASRLRPAQRDG